MARPRVWHREDIKAELRKRHGSLLSLARTWGMNDAAITHALISPHLRKPTCRRIAAALDLPPHALWPSVFAPEPVGFERGGHRNRQPSDVANQKVG